MDLEKDWISLALKLGSLVARYNKINQVMDSLCCGLIGDKFIVQAFPSIIKKTEELQQEEKPPKRLLTFQDYEWRRDESLNTYRVSFAPESLEKIQMDKSDLYITPTKPIPNQNTSLELIFTPDHPGKPAIGSGRTADTEKGTHDHLKDLNKLLPSLKTIKSVQSETAKITPQQYYNNHQRVVIQMTAASLTSLIQDKINKDKQKVFKRIQKSEYDSLRKNYKVGRWQDANFVKQKSFQTTQHYFDLKWKHLDQIFAGKKIVLFEDGVRTSDIIQGQIGDCYFLSAVAALARNPERILALFPEDKINTNGIFMTRMIFKGIKQEVTVDSYLPVFINKDKQSQLLGCKPNTDSSEIYTMILEKCWAKLWKSYEKIHGGYPHQALHALTGAVTKNYLLKEQTSNPQKNLAFFNRVLKFQKSEFVMCAGTCANNPMTEQKTSKQFIDIQPLHIYCVEDVRLNSKGEKIVQIYNPWGHNYIKNAKSNKKIQTSAHTQLTWQEFTRDFMYLTVCKVYDNAHYLYEEMDFKPRQLKFIDLTIHDKAANYISVTVSQTDKKEEANVYNPYLNLTYIVVKESQQQKGNYTLLAIKNSSKFSEHYMELVGLQPGKYLIAIYISDIEIKEKLTFAIYSESAFGFAQKKADFSFKNKFMHTVLRAYDKQRHLNLTQKGIKNDTIINVGLKGDAWISLNIMVNKSICGYLLGHVDSSGRGFRVRLGNKQLKQAGIRVLPPFDKQSDIMLQILPGNQALIIFVIDDFNKYLRHKFTALKDFHDYIGLKPERFPQ